MPSYDTTNWECPRCGGVANSRHACTPLTVEEAVALAVRTGERVQLRDDDGRVTGVISAPNTPVPPGWCCEDYAATLRARVAELEVALADVIEYAEAYGRLANLEGDRPHRGGCSPMTDCDGACANHGWWVKACVAARAALDTGKDGEG